MREEAAGEVVEADFEVVVIAGHFFRDDTELSQAELRRDALRAFKDTLCILLSAT